MSDEERAREVEVKHREFAYGVYYFIVVSIILDELNTDVMPKSSIIIFFICLLFPYLLFNLYETYLYRTSGNSKAISKSQFNYLWIIFIACIAFVILNLISF